MLRRVFRFRIFGFRIFRFLFLSSLMIGLVVGLIGAVGGMYFYIRLTRDLPQISKLGDYKPKAVTSVYADDGTLIAELYEERRYPAKFEDIPQLLKNAFLAAEDSNFYTHPGIDLRGIGRAIVKNFQHGSSVQGASTITQQIVKSLLLTREKTYERKLKEAILSYQLEKALSKDEIFSIYLNEIYLGSNSYGVKAAARVHFHKDMKDLSLAECAFIAGLPPKPSELASPRNRPEAMGRQRYVLDQMVKNNFITRAQAEEASKEELFIHAPDGPGDGHRVLGAQYYVSHVEQVLRDMYATWSKGEKSSGETATNPGGLSVYAAVDLKAYQLAVNATQRALRELDKRRGWRGPVGSDDEFLARLKEKAVGPLQASSNAAAVKEVHKGEIYRATITEVGAAIRLNVGGQKGVLDLEKSGWAKTFLGRDDRKIGIDLRQYLKPGQILEVSVLVAEKPKPKDEAAATAEKEPKEPEALVSDVVVPEAGKDLRFTIDQTPDIEGSFVLQNALTGEVKVLIGGYDSKRSEFNRATQALRQPGSSFKPFVYLSAVEKLHYTPTTIVPDSPISLVAGNGQLWSPGNFDHEYLGPITLRTALQRSRNVVSVFLVQKVGIDYVIDTAKRLGITTPINRNMSISLGTAEVKMIDIVHGYGAFAAGGFLADQIIVKKIVDRDGKVIHEQLPKQKKVIEEDVAFIMANMMKGVIERGTATMIKALGKPVAGKTGTTNDQMDAWFIGYTPEWVGGVWVGFDQKKMIGRMETGGKAAAPIFLYFMQDFLKDSPALDFDPPDTVVPFTIDLGSGNPVDPSTPGAFVEYFQLGSEPKFSSSTLQNSKDYLSSDEF